MFQINDANNNSFTHSFTLVSLSYAFWSLIYGVIYVVNFHRIRSIDMAGGLQVQRTSNPFLNVEILLAIPAAWLSWSIIMFFAAMLSFTWMYGSATDISEKPLPRIVIIARVIVTALLTTGAVNLFLVMHAFRNFETYCRLQASGHVRTAQDLAMQSGSRSSAYVDLECASMS